jgi:hypothetical protein
VLIEVQGTLILGHILVTLSLMSDGTHLSNFAGDVTEWPVYITFGNLSSNIRQKPSTYTVVMVALRPNPIKNCNIPQERPDEQQLTNREVLKEVLRRVCLTLPLKQHPNAEKGYYNIVCADGNFRCCKPVIAACLVDSPEYSDLYHLKLLVCFWSKYPKNAPGDHIPSDKQHHWCDHNLYLGLSYGNNKAADAKISLRHVPRGFSVFGYISRILRDLSRRDLLNTMHIGTFAYL